MKNTIKIFSETGCISHEVLWKYRQGKLSAAEKHEVELHLTDCDLCSDALAGMMSMDSDGVIAELRRSVRNTAVQKKVIRLTDFRVLAAAAAVAVFFVFIYLINSTNKNQNKEIAQLTKPQEQSKEETFAMSNSKPTDEAENMKRDSQKLMVQKTSTESRSEQKNNSEGFSGMNNEVTVAEAPATIESDADKQSEDVIMSGMASDTAVSAPTETKTGSYKRSETPAAAMAEKEQSLPTSRKKFITSSKNSESSEVTYYYDLKVAKTSALTSVEMSDTVSTGTPAQYESKVQVAEAQTTVRELPFVYSKTLKDGMGYYKVKKYEYAIQTFDIILERFPSDINSLFYKGLSEMESQNFTDASVLFKKAIAHQNKTFIDEAKFKLALCYTALNQTAQAKKLLEEISAGESFYRNRAKEELEKLK